MPIKLLGTSHISPTSKQEVATAISSGVYDVVALELDPQRLQKLLSGDTALPSTRDLVKAVGVSGALLAKVGHWIEHKLGAKVGTTPGDDMKTAIIHAGKSNIPVALIDQPIYITLKRFTKAFTFKEKLKLLKGAFRFTRVQVDIAGVPDQALITKMLGELEQISPALAQVLVHERNAYMCRALTKLQNDNPGKNILAVVGAGHVPGMTECLKTLDTIGQA